VKFKEEYIDLQGDMSVLVENAERILGKDIPELSPIEKADLSSLLSDIRDLSQKMATVGEAYGEKSEEMLRIHEDINLCMQSLVKSNKDPLVLAVQRYVSERLSHIKNHVLTTLYWS
jgi:seryl-tRNA synthetase